ncbi:hypothetical protein HYS00_01690 [Candidatus Microgenomates bacterium]|nr:hypothetical protein [Candidatus Microgenomates bacterium]
MNLTIVKPLIVFMFIGLAVANIGIFISSMQLSDKITYYSRESKRLKEENQDLEQKIYEVNSLQKAASQAAELDFTKKAQPNYLNNLGVALK